MTRNPFQPNRLSVLYSSTHIIRRGLYKAIRKYAPQLNGRILDLGCGSKPYENLFTGATEYIGCDIQTSGHDHSSSKIDVYYDGKTLPFEDGAFDGAVSFETFEHIFNLSEVLTEIQRVIKPGGYLLVTTPFAWGEHEQPYDFARYTSFGLTEILRTHGLSVVSLEKTNSHLLSTWQLMVTYFTQQVFPKNWVLGKILHVTILFPLTCLIYGLDRVLPKGDDFYSNLVVLARKSRERQP